LPAPVTASTVVMRVIAPRGELAVYGAAAVNADGTSQQLFGRTKSKYRPLYQDSEVRVLENTDALPRALLVHIARVAPSVEASLGEMIHRPFEPRQEVILTPDTSAEVTAAVAGATGGSAGAASVVGYSANAVRIHTSSSSPALLLLTDTYFPGWRAFVDGHEQPVARGDLLFRVVPVPDGEHDVDMRFEPTSLRLGLAISIFALVVVLALLAFAGITRRRGRTT